MFFDSEKRFVRIAEVMKIVALGRTTIYGMIDAGTFPQPVKLTESRVAWWLDEVLAWMHSRPRRKK